jgi:hypothetical protein
MKALKRVMAAEYSRDLSGHVRAGIKKRLVELGYSSGGVAHTVIAGCSTPIRRPEEPGDRRLRFVFGPALKSNVFGFLSAGRQAAS